MRTRAMALRIGQRPARSGAWPDAPIAGAMPVEAVSAEESPTSGQHVMLKTCRPPKSR